MLLLFQPSLQHPYRSITSVLGEFAQPPTCLEYFAALLNVVSGACRRRTKPGLRPQHLAGLQLIAEVTEGTLSGGHVESRCICLDPGHPHCGSWSSNTGTASSCSLLVQVHAEAGIRPFPTHICGIVLTLLT